MILNHLDINICERMIISWRNLYYLDQDQTCELRYFQIFLMKFYQYVEYFEAIYTYSTVCFKSMVTNTAG